MKLPSVIPLPRLRELEKNEDIGDAGEDSRGRHGSHLRGRLMQEKRYVCVNVQEKETEVEVSSLFALKAHEACFQVIDTS